MSNDVGGHDPDSKPGSSGIAEGGAESKPRQNRPRAKQNINDQARPFKPVVYVDRGLLPLFRRRWRSIIGGTVVFLSLVIWWGLQPLHGTIHVGICRTLIETQLKYPGTLRITATEWFRNDLRFYITFIDAFGQDRSEMFECEFNPDLTLVDARVDRQSIGADKVAAFNQTIPQIIAFHPDTTIPSPPKDNLYSLKRD